MPTSNSCADRNITSVTEDRQKKTKEKKKTKKNNKKKNKKKKNKKKQNTKHTIKQKKKNK